MNPFLRQKIHKIFVKKQKTKMQNTFSGKTKQESWLNDGEKQRQKADKWRTFLTQVTNFNIEFTPSEKIIFSLSENNISPMSMN